MQEKCKPAAHQGAVTTQPVLLLLHQKSSCAGAIGWWLKRHGYLLDIRRPTIGEPLPETLEHHAGIIVFGGPMSANDETAEVRREIDWLALALNDEMPYFGICLGAQMMVRQLGGEVTTHNNDLVEIGYHAIEPCKEGHELVPDWPRMCFQWHREAFSIPHGARRLATGTRFANQAFAYGDHVFGVQFHPEITRTMIERWSTNAAHMLSREGAHPQQRLFDDHTLYKEGQRHWLDQFMHHWTKLMRPSPLA